MKIAVLITTHNRAEMLLKLLHDIERLKQELNITVFILADGPQTGYDAVWKFASAKKEWIVADSYPEHCGKIFYFTLVTRLYRMVQNIHWSNPFDYFIQVPDDVSLGADFFNEAVAQFKAIKDPNKICLNLLNDGREQPNWTGVQHQDIAYNGYTYVKTQWVDMCYIADSVFFNCLGWEVLPIPVSWSGDTKKSSGVGLQISRRLFAMGKNMYLTSHSLVGHGAHDSQMHPNHRKLVPLIAIAGNEKIIAGMATIAGRLESMKEAVASLLPQVDKLYIMLNGYDKVPEFLKHSKIQAFTDITNSLGDAGKFISLHEKGYLLFCDDDIIYPADYARTMISAIEETDRKAIITIHGRQFKTFPVKSYYHDNSIRVSCLNTQPLKQYLHVPGTGVTAFHSSAIKLGMNDFKSCNMADIWLGVAAQKQAVPIVSIPHQKGWIKMSRKYDESYSIYSMVNRKDEYQTSIVNSIKWKLNTLKNEQSNAMA